MRYPQECQQAVTSEVVEMKLGSLLTGRVSRLVITGVAFVALSGVPAYADSGGYYTQAGPFHGAGYRSVACRVTGWLQNSNTCQTNSWDQNGAPYQNDPGYQAPQPQPATVVDHVHDDGNSK
jgi:hypothetical protein